jgi:hypothetical protein
VTQEIALAPGEPLPGLPPEEPRGSQTSGDADDCQRDHAEVVDGDAVASGGRLQRLDRMTPWEK